MELLVQLFRALANWERVKILRVLAVHPDLPVTNLAESIGLAPNYVSAHLRVLYAAGLVWRARSGKQVKYSLAGSHGHPVTQAVVQGIKRLYSSVARHKAPGTVAGMCADGGKLLTDRELFAFYTAFTHPRRLQVLQYLILHGETDGNRLAQELGMSGPAFRRHAGKLLRRGIVERVGSGDGSKWRARPRVSRSELNGVMGGVLHHLREVAGSAERRVTR